MDAAEPARPHEADPDRCGGGERAADRRRPDRSLHRADREVARPELARVRREPLELGRRRGRSRSPVEDADRRRGPHRPRARRPRSPGRPRPRRAPGSRARRASSRARRPHAPPRARPATSSLDADQVITAASLMAQAADPEGPSAADARTRSRTHGIEPGCCTHRAAASSARSGPPTIQPAASASPAPVVSTTSGTGSAARSSPSNEQPASAALEDPRDAGERARRRSRPRPRWRRRRRARAPRRARGTRRGPKSRIVLHDERSTLTRAPARAQARPRASRRRATGSRSSA